MRTLDPFDRPCGVSRRHQKIKDRIEAGDTYQINFTFRLDASFEGDPHSLMRSLNAAQGGQWGAFLDIGTHAICSASPELFFTASGQRVECRPMKGTMPRGLTPRTIGGRQTC